MAGSIGIALLNTYVTNAIHIHSVRLGEVFPPQSEEYARFGLQASQTVVRQAHGILATPVIKTAFGAGESIFRRAQVLGFENGFVYAGFILLAAVALCLLLQPAAHHGAGRPVPITE